MMKLLASTAVVMASLLNIAHAAPEIPNVSFDIVGIKLGESLEDARKKVNEISSDFIWTDVQNTKGGLYAVVAQRVEGEGKEEIVREEFVLNTSRDGRLTKISRTVVPVKDESFLVDQLISSLQEKYGVYVASGSPRLQMDWHYDINGKNVGAYGTGERAGCSSHYFNNESFRFVRSDGKNSRTSNRGINTVSPNCYIAIDANYRTDKYDVVTKYTITLIDPKTIYEDLVAEKEAAKEAERKRREDIEAKAKNSGGPSL